MRSAINKLPSWSHQFLSPTLIVKACAVRFHTGPCQRFVLLTVWQFHRDHHEPNVVRTLNLEIKILRMQQTVFDDERIKAKVQSTILQCPPGSFRRGYCPWWQSHPSCHEAGRVQHPTVFLGFCFYYALLKNLPYSKMQTRNFASTNNQCPRGGKTPITLLRVIPTVTKQKLS